MFKGMSQKDALLCGGHVHIIITTIEYAVF